MTEPDSVKEGPSDDEIRALLADAKTIAVVGLSSKRDRPSFEVSEFLQQRGYRIVPVNPNEAEVLGEPAYPTLLDVPQDITIDVVDVFRRGEHTPPIAEQAVGRGARMLWFQDGIVNEDAYRIAADAGLVVVMDDCIKRTVRRLLPPA